MWLRSSIGRASHRYRGGHGFESCWNLDFFKLLLSSCLNWKVYDDHSLLWQIIKPFQDLENAFNTRWNDLDTWTSLSYFIPYINFHSVSPILIFVTIFSPRSCLKTIFGHQWQPSKQRWDSPARGGPPGRPTVEVEREPTAQPKS